LVNKTPRLIAVARRRLEQLAFAPLLRTPEQKAADQEETLAILRDRLAPETYEEVREMVVCEWEEFERRARARFGDDVLLHPFPGR
jgi:hypothetical protein